MAEELGNAPHLPQEICRDQRGRTIFVEGELKRFANRLERDKVAPIFHMVVYAFNCDQKHEKHPPPVMHTDFVSGGGHDVPGGLNATIRSLEVVLAALKKRVQ